MEDGVGVAEEGVGASVGVGLAVAEAVAVAEGVGLIVAVELGWGRCSMPLPQPINNKISPPIPVNKLIRIFIYFATPPGSPAVFGINKMNGV